MRLLLAEDEVEMSRALVAVLEHSGYEVDAVYNGLEAIKKAKSGVYSCMIFDIMMPKLDGMEAIREIRSSGDTTPVIFLTAKAEIDDRIAGLDAGADDYLTKPFAMGELLARVRSMTRRQESYTPKVLHYGNVSFDVDQHEVKSDNTIRLGGKEAKLMEFFMLNPGKELSTDEIYQRVFFDEKTKDVVWMYINYLRGTLDSIAADIEILGEKDGSFQIVKRRED